MTHIKALVARICLILALILAVAEYKLLGLIQFFQVARTIVREMEDEMVPTWRETVWPLCAAILLVLAMYFVLAVGGD